jgi:hypothetical protein
MPKEVRRINVAYSVYMTGLNGRLTAEREPEPAVCDCLPNSPANLVGCRDSHFPDLFQEDQAARSSQICFIEPLSGGASRLDAWRSGCNRFASCHCVAWAFGVAAFARSPPDALGAPQRGSGVRPARISTIQSASMLPPQRMTPTLRPCMRPRSCISAARGAAPAPSARL